MSDTSSTPRLWRTAGPTPPGAARRARLLAVLLVLAALAGVGVALSFVTLGGSAAITSLVGAGLAAQMVIRVQSVLARLTAAARSVGRLDAVERLADLVETIAAGRAPRGSNAGGSSAGSGERP